MRGFSCTLPMPFGSVIAISNAAGQDLATYSYLAFDTIAQQTGSVNNPFGFTGRPLDPDSGLIYLRARYYDPVLGRFTSADPIGYQGGINLYIYAKNNPLRFIDPSGENPEEIVRALISGGVGFFFKPYDIFSAIIGVDPITGEELGTGGRILTLIGGKLLRAGSKVFTGLEEARKAQKLLPFRPVLTQKRLDHIVREHWHSSGAKLQDGRPKSKFTKEIDVKGLRKLINEVTDSRNPWSDPTKDTLGRQYKEVDLGRTVGVDPTGRATNWMTVIVDKKGQVVTAHPGKVLK